MSNNNTDVSKVILSEPQNLQLAKLIEEFPKDRQLSWLSLGSAKQTVKKSLENRFLEIQAYLIKYDTLSIVQLQDEIDKYNKGVKEIVKTRKGYTMYIDKITDDMMTVEKNAATWEVLEKAEKRYMELREEDEKKKVTGDEKSKEAAKFISHVSKEHIRIKTEYELMLNTCISSGYIDTLETDLNEVGLKNRVIIMENTLTNIKTSSPVRFTKTLPEGYKPLNSVEELTALGQKIVPPNYSNILATKILEMKDRFNMYFSDRKNKDKAKEQINKDNETAKLALTKEAETKSSVEDLKAIGSVGGVVMSFENVKPIIRKTVIVIKDTKEFAFKVASAFIGNFDRCTPNMKIKNWENLKISQMADALSKLPEQLSEFDYEEIKK